MSRLLVIGAGGHGKVVADAGRETGRWEEIAFVDDGIPPGTEVLGYPVIGAGVHLGALRADYRECVVAIGNNALRWKLMQSALEAGFETPVIVHPRAHVSVSATIGMGTTVMAGAVVQADARLGEGVIVNTSASVDHDCEVGDATHICPGVSLGGAVRIGRECWIGIGSTVREGVNIGSNSVIGAAAGVVNDLPSGVTAVGLPARVVSGRS